MRLDLTILLLRQCDDLGLPRPNLLDTADHLPVLRALGGQRHNGKVRVQHRDRSVFQLSRRVPFGVEVADFLQLQRAL